MQTNFEETCSLGEENVGPGRYRPEDSYRSLKKRPCMAVLKPGQLLDEGSYEATDHVRVL